MANKVSCIFLALVLLMVSGIRAQETLSPADDKGFPLGLVFEAARVAYEEIDPSAKHGEVSDAFLLSGGLFLAQKRPPQGHNEWDSYEMTAFERVLYCIQDILSCPKAQIMAFIDQARPGIMPYVEPNAIKGIVRDLVMMDPDSLSLIDLSIWKNMIQENMVSQKRSVVNDPSTSELRSLMFLIDSADMVLKVAGIPLLSMVSSRDGSTVADKSMYPEKYTRNLTQWTIGEVITAVEWGEKGQIPNVGYATAYEAFDWMLYKKRYRIKLMGIPLMGFDGITGLMDAVIVKALMPVEITESFDAFIQLAGGHGPGTAGKDHRIFSLFCPVMRYMWDQGRVGNVVALMTGMNEIPLKGYRPLSQGKDATLINDHAGIVLKSIEGPSGYGLIYYAMKDHGPDAPGVIDPVLDISFRIIKRLDNTPAPPPWTGTLFDALVDRFIPEMRGRLMDENASPLMDEKLLDKTDRFITDNHKEIVSAGHALGVVLLDMERDHIMNQICAHISGSPDMIAAVFGDKTNLTTMSLGFLRNNDQDIISLVNSSRALITTIYGDIPIMGEFFDFLDTGIHDIDGVSVYLTRLQSIVSGVALEERDQDITGALIPGARRFISVYDPENMDKFTSALGEICINAQRDAVFSDLGEFLATLDKEDVAAMHDLVQTLCSPLGDGRTAVEHIFDFASDNRVSFREITEVIQKLLLKLYDNDELTNSMFVLANSLLNNLDNISLGLDRVLPPIQAVFSPENQAGLMEISKGAALLLEHLQSNGMAADLGRALREESFINALFRRDASGMNLYQEIIVFVSDNAEASAGIIDAAHGVITNIHGRDELVDALFDLSITFIKNINELIGFLERVPESEPSLP